MRLKGKTALVTGGSRGIGKAIVEALSGEGAQVVFTYNTMEEAAKRLVGELSGKGLEVHCQRMNVIYRDEVRSMLEEIKTTFGRLDILVNNAGINKPADFDRIDDEDWDKVLDINLKGPFICTQEAIPLLIKSGRASVINIGSVSGQYGGPRTAHYAASKAGLISLSQVIARFGANNNIRSNTVSAGLIASDMADEGLKSPAVKEALKKILLQRMGTMKEVADAVVFLASDESAYITAQTINVNGGIYF